MASAGTNPFYVYNVYEPIPVYFPVTDLDSSHRIWTAGIETSGSALTYPYIITAAWWGLSGDLWEARMTIALDPTYTFDPVPDVDLTFNYTIYYLYQ
jgi:hypothetical protein